MKTKFAASVLSALLYAQGLLGFAALAAVLMKDRAHAEIVAGWPSAAKDRSPSWRSNPLATGNPPAGR
jgi:hypothetical protein